MVALAFDKNIGFVAITAAVLLAMLSPNQHKDAIKQIAWPTVLLVAGVSTYSAILTEAHSPEFVGKWATGLGAVVIGALMLANRPGHHHRTRVLPADPHLQHDRSRRRTTARLGGSRGAGLVELNAPPTSAAEAARFIAPGCDPGEPAETGSGRAVTGTGPRWP